MTAAVSLKGADDAAIRAALGAANPTCLRAVLFQLTGDPVIAKLKTEPAVGTSDRAAPPALEREEDRELVRRRMAEVLGRIRDGSFAVPPEPSLEQFRPLAECFFAESLSEQITRFWYEEFGVQPLPRGVDMSGIPEATRRAAHVIVIGGGMNGITAGVALKAAGVSFTIIEQNPDLGGTWERNRYPGARVDVASFAYCNTYEPFHPWQHNYAVRDELKDYLRGHATKHGLWDHVRLNTKVTALRWDGANKRWNIDIEGASGKQTLQAQFVISAIGLFGRASFPNIAGLDSFQGRLLHSTQWDPDYDIHGKRIAVIGTGSSGIQMIGPLSRQPVKQITIFQRSPAWLANVPGYEESIPDAQRWLSDNVPYYRNWLRLTAVYGVGDAYGKNFDIDPQWKDPHTVNAANHRLRTSLMDYMKSKLGHRPELLEKCTPNYPPLAKRLPKDNGWYDAVLKDNVELVTEGIERVTPRGVLTRDGKEREFDLIVLATGFKASEFLLSIDVQGDGVSLKEAWSAEGARAYWGVTIPHFPNLFCTYGPNTNGRAVGPAAWGEMQVRYALKCIRNLLSSGKRTLSVRQEPFKAYNEELDARLAKMIFSVPGQSSYYVNEHGRIATNGGFYNREYYQWSYEPDMGDYHVA